MKFKQTAMTAACACAVSLSALTVSSNALAANWLMLQGTEPAGSAERAKVWGFIQPEYQYTGDTKLKGGPWADQDAVFNQQRPDLKTASGFNVLRARVGVRGNGLPLDSKVNYFFLAEFGNNGITRGEGGAAIVSDASVTFNHIPFARVRFGQFKYPGSEEGLQAIHVFDYINFTNITNTLLLERFFDYDGSGTAVKPTRPPTVEDSANPNNPNGPVGAFRDIGIQIFDTFKIGSWEHGYAAMVGNGNGIARGDNDDNKDVYLYWSSEWVFGGKGPRRQGWKMFAWGQDGKRTLINENGTTTTADDFVGEYDRKRWGVGTTFRKSKYRAAFEYVAADGMIFNGTDGGAVAGAVSNPIPQGPGNPTVTSTASWNMLPEDEADGFYVDFGYLVIPKLELDIRYDTLNRATKTANAERKFDTVTLGAQYFFNKKTRLILNYEFREGEAPNLPSTDNANKVLDSMDDRASLQVLAIF
ncbi:hypothetical protein [Kaarinaea lacus]